jgi:hypothetical protein
MGVSWNGGTPKSSVPIDVSIKLYQPCWSIYIYIIFTWLTLW